MKKLTAIEFLEHIDPSRLDYTGWVNVGMALHHEGASVQDWDSWSSRDTQRFIPGDCEVKWNGFGNGTSIVTLGTLYSLARDHGWEPEGSSGEGRVLEWDSVITDDYRIVDTNWVEGTEFSEPTVWDPVKEVRTYLETLFRPDEFVSYVMESYQNEKGKFLPAAKGAYSRTVGEILNQFDVYDKNILSNVLGDYNPEAGAWIRFNPMDGKGVDNSNVSEFRYALVESDDMELSKQHQIMRDLELPVAVLMYSGGKSIHAIVKIDAKDQAEYKERVDFLYKVCGNNGLTLDTQNRNVSRLSRLPGIERGSKKQFIIDTHIGQEDWNAWYEWVEDLNDDLPDPEDLSEVWDDLPPLSPTLIEGVLRVGHKMLIAGPSKAGKSFMLINQTICIAEGLPWLGWPCRQGRVMYVNLELDRASALHRFKEVYKAMGIEPRNVGNIDIWNLRGNTAPLDKLAPKLIRRAQKKGYAAIIVDPIYKVLTGDENSASEMAHFTNQFDKIATQLGASVIYCHHHSKGGQGGKRAMDRSSGSGVFARDPDAVLDLVELDVTEDARDAEINRLKAELYNKALMDLIPNWHAENVTYDDEFSAFQLRRYIGEQLNQRQIDSIDILAEEVEGLAYLKSAWRVEGTLREFPSFKPVNMWFEYPLHVVEDTGKLGDLSVDGEQAPWERGTKGRKKQAEKQRNKNEDKFHMAIGVLKFEDSLTLDNLADELGLKERATRNWIKKYGYQIDKNDGSIVQNPDFVDTEMEE